MGRSRARKQKPTASSTGVQAGGGHITSNPKRPELQRKYSNSKAVSDPQNKILDRPQCTSDIEKERGRPGGSANTTQEEKDSGRDSPKKRSKTAGLVTTAISTRPAPGRKIVDKELDHVNWAIKDIVRWGNARERRMEKEKAKRKEADAEDAEKNSQGQRRNSIQAVATTEKQFSTNLAKRREDEGQMALAPQVTVVEGKIVVNRHSLTVQAQEKQEYTRVVTEDANKLNSMTYMSRISNERWSAEDTELFYKAVSQFGTDFTLITHLFPGRQRRHLKNKFTRESKINPMRMDQALQASAQATIQSYEEMIAMLRESGTDVGNKGSGQEGEMLQLEDAKTVVVAQQPARSGPSNRGRRKKVTRGES